MGDNRPVDARFPPCGGIASPGLVHLVPQLEQCSWCPQLVPGMGGLVDAACLARPVWCQVVLGWYRH